MSAAAIQDVPVEVLQEIFVQACTDGGTTGCSISLVSQAFRAAVQPIQYHSIELTGLAQISTFASRYTETCSALAAADPLRGHPKVRHLLLTSHRDMRRRSVYAHEEADKKEALAAIANLLALLAPDLHTLVLITAYRHTDLFQGCEVGFPCLRDLTMARIHGIDLPDLGAPKLPPEMRFPRLERLHFALRVVNRSLEQLLSHWTMLAPAVVELRLSNLPPRATRAGLNTAFCKRPETGVVIFPQLRKLWAQPFTLPDLVIMPLESDTARADRNTLTWAIIGLGGTCRKETSVFLLPSDYETGAQHSIKFGEGWRDGIVGGEAFWSGGEDVRRGLQKVMSN